MSNRNEQEAAVNKNLSDLNHIVGIAGSSMYRVPEENSGADISETPDVTPITLDKALTDLEVKTGQLPGDNKLSIAEKKKKLISRVLSGLIASVEAGTLQRDDAVFEKLYLRMIEVCNSADTTLWSNSTWIKQINEVVEYLKKLPR